MTKERHEIDRKYKWDLSVIYANEDAFYADYAKVEALVADFAKYETMMCESAEGLYKTLRAATDIEEIIEKLWHYASLHFAVETANNAYQALNAKVRALAIKAGTASWFVSPYLLRLEEETVQAWLAEYPALETFRRMIEKNMRMKPHTLSDECEKLMSGLEDAFGSHGDIRGIFANADMRFGKIKNDEGKSVELYLRSSDRRVRRAAFNMMYKTYGQFVNTFATVYNGRVKEETTLAKARGYKDSITASTFRLSRVRSRVSGLSAVDRHTSTL